MRPWFVMFVLTLAGCWQPPTVPTTPSAATNAPNAPILAFTPAATALVLERQHALGMHDPFWVRFSIAPRMNADDPYYRFELATAPRENEYAFTTGGINVVIPGDQVEQFRNAGIDFDLREGISGFLISSPQVEGGLPLWLPVAVAAQINP